MIIPGLVSVTFRKKTPQEIVALCEKAQLKAIEWGGDLHVPPCSANAKEIRSMCQSAGIEICSYGSYYRVTQPMEELYACLDTAHELGTKIVRIWCGPKGSAAAEQDGDRAMIVDSLLRCAEAARERSLTLALEYHGNTLTDDRNSVKRLVWETESVSDALSFYWQPRWDWTTPERLSSLDDVRSRLSHLHVFTWAHEKEGIVRLPLEKGAFIWENVLSTFSEDHHALLEFVENDSDEALLRDAASLNQWICG